MKEILNNIVKHAEATEVKTTITFSDNTFEIRIADNGKGFDTTTPKNGKGGNGLKNICERLKAIGGKCDIFSKKNEGTTIVLSISINQS